MSSSPSRLVRAIASCLVSIVSTILFMPGAGVATAATALPNSVAIDGFTVSYPDGWSTLLSGRVTMIVEVTADKLATLTSDQLLVQPQVRVSTEARVDHNDAMHRLGEVAGESSDTVTHLTIGGWPAIQRRHSASWPIPGSSSPANGQALTIVTAIAAGNQIIRLDGSLPSDAPLDTADLIAAMQASPYRELEIEPARYRMPVRDVTF